MTVIEERVVFRYRREFALQVAEREAMHIFQRFLTKQKRVPEKERDRFRIGE